MQKKKIKIEKIGSRIVITNSETQIEMPAGIKWSEARKFFNNFLISKQCQNQART